ncbi:hypothetical protein P5673_016061 [Acropora cervicornis]|uniref:Uncharacterized protein n=1 Tax=Acropora cervicornis TaxID=6130 RepID=A0AAD9V4H3_ACRCE|nr:hypothetical protein P5673_016061 [Acropora cervicornis]
MLFPSMDDSASCKGPRFLMPRLVHFTTTLAPLLELHRSLPPSLLDHAASTYRTTHECENIFVNATPALTLLIICRISVWQTYTLQAWLFCFKL